MCGWGLDSHTGRSGSRKLCKHGSHNLAQKQIQGQKEIQHSFVSAVVLKRVEESKYYFCKDYVSACNYTSVRSIV